MGYEYLLYNDLLFQDWYFLLLRPEGATRSALAFGSHEFQMDFYIALTALR